MKENPDAVRALKGRRRAAEFRADGHHTAADIKRIFADQGGICAACKIDVSGGYQVDHVRPLSRDGSNWPENLQILCKPCNCSKNDRTMCEWIASGCAPPRMLAFIPLPASAE